MELSTFVAGLLGIILLGLVGWLGVYVEKTAVELEELQPYGERSKEVEEPSPPRHVPTYLYLGRRSRGARGSALAVTSRKRVLPDDIEYRRVEESDGN